MIASISRIKTFKACPKSFFFKYVEGLEPVEKSVALETGSSYHELLEEMYSNNGEFTQSLTKECAMANDYKKYIYPKFEMVNVEAWYEKKIGKHTLVGRVDGINDKYIVEHKTSGLDIGDEYEYNLLWNEQVLAYMSLTGLRKMIYTVCKKPTIRQKQNETDEEFFDRMCKWYDVDTESKIRMFFVERTDQEIANFEVDFAKTCDMIEKTDHMYRNTCNCNMWGRRCEYSSICLNYNPSQEYVEFTKEDRSKPYGS